MYTVQFHGDLYFERSVTTLDEAMCIASKEGCLVTISNDEITIVGKFGVDSVADGKLPDGADYTWKKRRI